VGPASEGGIEGDDERCVSCMRFTFLLSRSVDRSSSRSRAGLCCSLLLCCCWRSRWDRAQRSQPYSAVRLYHSTVRVYGVLVQLYGVRP
jgi:hypothetical protein